MMKFLIASTDTPHIKGVVKEHLPLPEPGVDEYRRYWNEHETQQTDYSTMMDPEAEPKTITVLTANFVSMQCDHEPSDEEWRQLLKEEGYNEEQINTIIGNA